MISLCKVIKEKYVNDVTARENAMDAIAQFLSSCADETGDHMKYHHECVFIEQPRPDGMLAIIGTLNREPTPYYQAETFDEETEFIVPPVVPEPFDVTFDPTAMSR